METKQRYKELIEALISKSESLMQRARAIDQKLLGKKPKVELGEVTRMETTIQNVKNELKNIEENPDIQVLLVWDREIGKHRQCFLNKSLQQPRKGVVYLSEGMSMQKTYEEEMEGGNQ